MCSSKVVLDEGNEEAVAMFLSTERLSIKPNVQKWTFENYGL
jgi:hypothetical protein